MLVRMPEHRLIFPISKNRSPDAHEETAVLEELMGPKRKKPLHGRGLVGSQGSLVAGKRNTPLLRNGANDKGDPLGSPSVISQESLVAGAGFEPAAFRL